MRKLTFTLIPLLLLACDRQPTPPVASAPQDHLQSDRLGHDERIVTFDAPHAGTGAGQGTWSVAINPSGTTTGWVVDGENLYHGFVHDLRGKVTTFDALGAQYTFALGITPEGAIAGATIDDNSVYHGFIRTPEGRFIIFDVPGAGTGAYQGTYPVGISPEGVVAGIYVDANDMDHGFVRTAEGTLIKFDVPGAAKGPFLGSLVCPSACINSNGEVTGYYYDAGGAAHGYLRTASGKFDKFNVPGASTGENGGTYPNGMNSAGAITGYYADDNGGAHAFVRAPDGSITEFDVPGQEYGEIAESIDDTGVIVGFYVVGHAGIGFIRTPDGSFTTFAAPGAGTAEDGQGTYPNMINQSGMITGYYVDASNVTHGFLRLP